MNEVTSISHILTDLVFREKFLEHTPKNEYNK